MRVYIVGAGPGDPELITLRGARLVEQCPIVLYTGSLVPRDVLARARSDAKVMDSASMTLDEIMEVMLEARDADEDVARVHTGDPTVFASTAEQMRQMAEAGIPYAIVPGVSSFSAAACALGRELTLPEVAQTVVLTRTGGRTPMPDGEGLADLGRNGGTLALFLSVTLLAKVADELVPVRGADCPVVVVHKASLPGETIVRGTLADIYERVRQAKIRSQSIVLVGRALTCEDFPGSRLYDPTFTHRFRRARTEGRSGGPRDDSKGA